MRPQGHTFWLLDGRTGWRTAYTENVSVGVESGIRLAADPEGPLTLSAAAGDLGGLTMPRGMALDDDGILYLLSERLQRIKRYDVETGYFVTLPTVGGRGPETRQFETAVNIACAGPNLYVADRGNRRVTAFDRESLALRHMWEVSPLFSAHDLIDPIRLAVKLRDATDPLSEYLFGRLSAGTQQRLQDFDGIEPPSAALLWALIDELNWLLRGGRLYDPQRFAHVDLSDETLTLIAQRPQGRRLIELHRLLLEEAYPDEIAKGLWEPYDVTGRDSHAYILDRRHGRVYTHRAGTNNLRLLIDRSSAAYRWTRIAVDREDRVYLLDQEVPCLEIFDALGRHVGAAMDAGDVRDRFDPPPLRLDHKGRFCLPASLARDCQRAAPDPPAPIETPLALCPPWSWSQQGAIYDREGSPLLDLDPAEPLGPPPYHPNGTWISQPLDSEIYDCQWHRLELDMEALPAGTQVVVSTYADQQLRGDDEIQDLSEQLWDTKFAITGQMQPPPGANVDLDAEEPQELLIQSRTGRYLWLRLELRGDGYATPAVRAIRTHYPRESYLEYLPAVFGAEDEGRWFLERFLSIFQTDWDALERQIEEISHYFDPNAVPAGEALEYLAAWLALPLEGAWNWEQKRRLLEAMPSIYSRRGRAEGLRHFLQVYLQNITGLTPEEQGAYPQIVEGFREREFLLLSTDKLANLGHGAPLWGPDIIGRLQLDVYAREGQVRLVSTGDPERDLFHEYAHRFRVFVPSAWVRTADDERMVRRALDAEKPAHTAFDLCLVEPRFRVGLQSTIGLDTIIGTYPVARLACQRADDAPPSRPPRHRLGYDTVLAGASASDRGIRLTPSTRVGVDTILV